MKIQTLSFKAIVGKIAFVALFFSSLALSAAEIGQLSEGPPTLMGQAIPESGYVKVETQKLTRAKVVWLNWDYLEKSGVNVGDRTITPEIERLVIDAFGWGVRADNEPADAFSKSEKKTFYADRYGGDGLAGNMGSGRAASAGKIQIKGIGKTELVTTIGPSHSNGTADLAEAMREAIYGEVGQKLPYGANRVIAILDRGTKTKFPDGYVQTNALIVREDPLRPAHYMKNLWGRGPLMTSESKRTTEALKLFEAAFPVPAKSVGLNKATRIRESVLGYADRVAEQFAAAFVLKIYHGATSVSNIEASGRFLDYGTMTTVPDYGRLKIIQINDPVGEITEFKNILMLEFLQNIRQNFPAEIAKSLPTDEEMIQKFEKTYAEKLDHNFLRLTGLSESQLSKFEATESAKKLTKILQNIATLDSKELLDPPKAQYLTRLNLNRILVALAGSTNFQLAGLEFSLKTEMPLTTDAHLKYELAKAYAELMSMANPDRNALLAEAKRLNAEHPEAYRWELYQQSWSAVKEYTNTQKADAISKVLDQAVETYRTRKSSPGICSRVFAL